MTQERTAPCRRLDGNACIVTGGSSGIGFAVVERLTAEGARVLFCGRGEARGLAAQQRLPDGRAFFMRADVGVEADVEKLIAAGAARFGRLDVLVNNAAKGIAGAIPDHSTERWHRSQAVNVDSVFYACRAVIPHMRKAGRGVIINVASISGLAGDGAYPSYCAQKAAVINLTRAMAVCHAREHIRINAVCPGFIETQSTAGFGSIKGLLDEWRRRIPAQRFGRPEEIAGLIAFLASEDASYIHGAVLVADGGITAATGQPTEMPVA